MTDTNTRAVERVVICASEATVVRDAHNPTPYKVSGCVVGEPVERDGRTYLRGWTFVTEVRTEHERARWQRDEAPDPCPYCEEQPIGTYVKAHIEGRDTHE